MELVICLPLIFVLIFGSIEACNMITVKQIATQAAYDGALSAVRPDAVAADVVSSVTTVLSVRNINPQSIMVEGTNGDSLSQVVHGESLVVTVTVTADGNVVGPQLFGSGRTLTSTATAIKQ